MPELIEIRSRLVHAPPLGNPGWIRIDRDGAVRLYCARTEMGQGIRSALAQIVNEELEADPRNIRVEAAPIWRAYASSFGFVTGGSTSIREMFTPMRMIGAAARIMLVEAAASRWRVSPQDCTAAAGYIRHATSGRRASYGELASAAAHLRAPVDPPLKSRAEWRSIGRTTPRLGARSKTDGTATFGIDVKLPGLLTAAVSQSPWPAGKVESLDRQAALRQSGVVDVIDLGDAVAVTAPDYWRAFRGLQSASVAWRAPDVPPDSQQLRAQLLERLQADQPPTHRSSRVVSATYEVPLLMHMQLEPLNATARVHGLEAEIWAPTQAPDQMQQQIASALFLPLEMVTVHVTRVGGGFGRRLFVDEGVVAARIARKAGAPIKAIWSREEDSAHDRFRPMAAARLDASLDATGAPSTLRIHIASLGDRPRTSGLEATPYRAVRTHTLYSGLSPAVRIGYWRSVDASQNVFFRESFIDECAHSAGADPLAYRLQLLGDDHARGRRLLQTLGEACGWRWPQSGPRVLGLAYHEGFGSISAQAIELSPTESGASRIERIVVVVDCGTVVNPDGVRAQIEGGVLFALSAALGEEATYVHGRLIQRNFDRYPVLRIDDAPRVEVRILETPTASIGGMGEVGVPPLAPALANAVFAATGVRLRRLPLRGARLSFSQGRNGTRTG